MGDDEKVEPVVKGNVVEQVVSDEDFRVSDEGSFNADNYMDNMGSSGTLEFKTPELDSEEGGEQNMPLRHRCDACRIIGLTMQNAFDAKVNLYPSIRDGKKELSESQIDEILEDVCDKLKTWDGVGMKVIHGVQRLSAPGFETEQVPGITQGGMKWPWRFKTHCNHLLEEMGEEEIYSLYRDSKSSILNCIYYSLYCIVYTVV